MNLETKITIYKFTPQLFTLTLNFQIIRDTHQSPISSPSIEVSTDSLESEKVWRLCRFGQNLPLSERIQPENHFPFTSVQ